MNLKDLIVGYLKRYHKGKGKAIGGEEFIADFLIVFALNTTQKLFSLSERKLRNIVNSLRREGVLIGSCKDGYYWIQTPDEAADTIKYLTASYRSRAAAVKGLKRGVAKKWNMRFEL
jgi:hypothetical protein